MMMVPDLADVLHHHFTMCIYIYILFSFVDDHSRFSYCFMSSSQSMCIYFLLLDVTDDAIKIHGYADDGVARFILLCNPEYILTSVESSKNVSMQVIAIVSTKWWYILS